MLLHFKAKLKTLLCTIINYWSSYLPVRVDLLWTIQCEIPCKYVKYNLTTSIVFFPLPLVFVFVLDIVNFAEFVPNFRLNLKNLCNVFLAIIISEGGKNCVFFSPPQGKVEILAEKLLCTLLQWGVNDFSSRILIF